MNSFETIADKGPFKFIVSTRYGGYSSSPFDSLNLGLNTMDEKEIVQKNRNHFFSSFLPERIKIAYASQVHGSHIAVVKKAGQLRQTDGFFTCSASIALSLTIADCFPVFLGGPISGCFALLHVGWRGGAARILPKAIIIFESRKIEISSLIMAIGPGISAKYFEIGPEVKLQFDRKFWTGEPNTKGFLDLKAVIIDQFLSLGGRIGQIIDNNECTYGEEEKYYSHRRDKGKTGRMLALAWKK